MTDDEKKRLRFNARIMTSQLMIAHAQSLAPEALPEFAAGLIEGIRDALTAYRDGRTAYDTVQAVADTLPASLLESVAKPL